MERFCKDLKEHITKIINYEKEKEMIPLTNEEKGSCSWYLQFKIRNTKRNIYSVS